MGEAVRGLRIVDEVGCAAGTALSSPSSIDYGVVCVTLTRGVGCCCVGRRPVAVCIYLGDKAQRHARKAWQHRWDVYRVSVSFRAACVTVGERNSSSELRENSCQR